MADLYNRIKRLKSAPREARTRRDTPDEEALEPLGLEEWTRVAPFVYTRETEEKLPDRVAQAYRAHGSNLTSALLGGDVGTEELRFMDTETTGLSGGAGTTVFLVGAGRVDGSTIRVLQTLLVDFPGEPDFLKTIAESLGEGVWVSYNGKAFDTRLIESRFVLNGIRPLAATQLDLLYWSRRMWRSALGSCALSDIERMVLDRGRTDDIPGSEIPERFFVFLRTRDATPLAPVFEHHRLDIVSLVHLYARLESILADPFADASIDPYQLGRYLVGRDDVRAIGLLERAIGSPIADPVRSAMLLSRMYRRRRDSEDALRVLLLALARVEVADALPLVVEVAKVHEHDLRDPVAALAVIDEYGQMSGEPVPPHLAHRAERLRRKALLE